jgi:hypothetical protein
MRLNCTFKMPARLPQKEPVPFQEILPLKLKATVSGKGDKTSGLYCIVLYCIYSAFLTSMRRIQNIVNIQHTDINKYIKVEVLNTIIEMKLKI